MYRSYSAHRTIGHIRPFEDMGSLCWIVDWVRLYWAEDSRVEQERNGSIDLDSYLRRLNDMYFKVFLRRFLKLESWFK